MCHHCGCRGRHVNRFDDEESVRGTDDIWENELDEIAASRGQLGGDWYGFHLEDEAGFNLDEVVEEDPNDQWHDDRDDAW